MKSAEYRLKHEMPLDANDEAWASMIAEAFTEKERLPYRYFIDHDIRAAACRKGGPKTGACPLRYTWANRENIGIETMNKAEAKLWLKQALLAGYTVGYADKNLRPIDSMMTIQRARSAAEWARKGLSDDRDDDIPF